jgi:hypothetical protein
MTFYQAIAYHFGVGGFLPQYAMPPLRVVWERDFNCFESPEAPTSAWCGPGGCGTGGKCPLAERLYLGSARAGPPYTNENRDEWDWWVMAHEFYHYFHHMFQAKKPTYGSGAKFAWTEGFATGMASASLLTKYSVQEVGSDANPAFVVENLDYNGEIVNGVPLQAVMPVNGEFSDGWVWRILWDLADPTSQQEPEPEDTFFKLGYNAYPDFDRVDGTGLVKLFDTLVGYLGGNQLAPNPALGNPDNNGRGPAGLELWDFLDGFLCRGHATEAELTPLVNEVMDHAYDYGGPIACP